MTPNDLDMFKVKNTNRHVTYTHEAQIFLCFALWQAVFEFRSNLQKSTPNDPTWPWHVQRQKYQHACYIHIRGPNFRLFHSTMSRFWIMANFWQSAPNDPKWHIQGQKYQHACHIHNRNPNFRLFCSMIRCFWSRSKIPTFMLRIPLKPNFPRFRSTTSHFWVMAQFLEKCTEWPQITLTCSR